MVGTNKMALRYDSSLDKKSVCYVAVYIDNEENPRCTTVPKLIQDGGASYC